MRIALFECCLQLLNFLCILQDEFSKFVAPLGTHFKQVNRSKRPFAIKLSYNVKFISSNIHQTFLSNAVITNIPLRLFEMQFFRKSLAKTSNTLANGSERSFPKRCVHLSSSLEQIVRRTVAHNPLLPLFGPRVTTFCPD